MNKSKCKHHILNHIKNKNTFSYPYSNTLLWFNESTAGLFVVQVLQLVNCRAGHIDGCQREAFFFGTMVQAVWLLSWHSIGVVTCHYSNNYVPLLHYMLGQQLCFLYHYSIMLISWGLCHVTLSVKLGQSLPELSPSSWHPNLTLPKVSSISFTIIALVLSYFFILKNTAFSLILIKQVQNVAPCLWLMVAGTQQQDHVSPNSKIWRHMRNLFTWHSSSNFIKYSNLLCLW